MAKILIIDDDANLCVALGAFLERHHHTVSFKTNGTDGLQAVREAAPEVIICDLDMPGSVSYTHLTLPTNREV